MSDTGLVNNLIKEDLLISFRESIRNIKTLKIVCIGEFSPLTQRSIEIISLAHKHANTYSFVKNSNPIIVVPIFREKFENHERWESAMCCLINHRKVDYVIDIRSLSKIDVVDRFKPDFIFVDRNLKVDEVFNNYVKRFRIKIVRV